MGSGLPRLSRWLILCLVTLWGCDQTATLPEIPEFPPTDLNRLDPMVWQQVAKAQAELLGQPEDPESNALLAKIMHVYRRFDAAEVLYARARSLKPGVFHWAHLHGKVLDELGRSAEAIAAFRDGLRMQPGSRWSKRNLAELLLASGAYEEGRQLSEELVRAEPDWTLAHYLLGKLLLDGGEVAAASSTWTERSP